MRRNVADLEAIALRQRVMRDMTRIDMSVETLGQTLKMPVGLSPVGMAGMYASRGEAQAIRAATTAGVLGSGAAGHDADVRDDKERYLSSLQRSENRRRSRISAHGPVTFDAQKLHREHARDA